MTVRGSYPNDEYRAGTSVDFRRPRKVYSVVKDHWFYRASATAVNRSGADARLRSKVGSSATRTAIPLMRPRTFHWSRQKRHRTCSASRSPSGQRFPSWLPAPAAHARGAVETTGASHAYAARADTPSANITEQTIDQPPLLIEARALPPELGRGCQNVQASLPLAWCSRCLHRG